MAQILPVFAHLETGASVPGHANTLSIVIPDITLFAGATKLMSSRHESCNWLLKAWIHLALLIQKWAVMLWIMRGRSRESANGKKNIFLSLLLKGVIPSLLTYFF
jgi:hypothetical protein